MNELLYIDPGIGAMLAQAGIAAAAGVAIFYKTVLHTVKSWLGIQPKKDKADFDDVYDTEKDN
ncbi:hypothetical protein [Nonlabens xiamenensis]|uniref:hypothetical protein n=1 Tax=Nonlabens xiamenensis TaxID=2341043 RepID=UPI000F61348B|nr:hypothetical protein [Nonlabens xiamenensis]